MGRNRAEARLVLKKGWLWDYLMESQVFWMLSAAF